MDDPFESHLRSLMQEDSATPATADDERLKRVLHRANVRSGLFDLLSLFARWAWVIGEGGARGLRHARPVKRKSTDNPSSDLNL